MDIRCNDSRPRDEKLSSGAVSYASSRYTIASYRRIHGQQYTSSNYFCNPRVRTELGERNRSGVPVCRAVSCQCVRPSIDAAKHRIRRLDLPRCPRSLPLFDALVSNVTQIAPDIIVFDVGTIGAQYLVKHLSVPYVVNSPTLLFDLNGEPSYVPSWGTGFTLDMSLWGRCMNVLFPRLLSFMQVNKQRWELGLPPYRSQHEIFRQSRMILNTAFGLEYPRPLNPLIDLVGPILPAQVGGPSSLPPLLNNFVQGNVVYVSLGSMTYLESWQVDTLIHGLNHPEKYRVLWSISLDQRRDFPSTVPSSFRIKSLGTAAHFSMLANPSVRVVVSHCGLAAAQEALYFGNPVLCIPFMMDQPDVAARVIDAGVGMTLDKTSFTVDEIQASIRQLTVNTSYAKRAESLGDVLQRAGGAKQAAKIIETTMISGWDHVKSTSVVSTWHSDFNPRQVNKQVNS